MFQLKINSYFVKLCNKTCGTTRFRIEGFDLNLHIDAEFALRDTGRSDSKKILRDPTKDNFSVFFFLVFLFLFFTLSTRKIVNRLSLQKFKFTFPLTFVLIVSAGRPLFDSQQLPFLLVEWVRKNTHFSLPHPFALFLLASLGGSPPQSERLEEAIRHTSIAF